MYSSATDCQFRRRSSHSGLPRHRRAGAKATRSLIGRKKLQQWNMHRSSRSFGHDCVVSSRGSLIPTLQISEEENLLPFALSLVGPFLSSEFILTSLIRMFFYKFVKTEMSLWNILEHDSTICCQCIF